MVREHPCLNNENNNPKPFHRRFYDSIGNRNKEKKTQKKKTEKNLLFLIVKWFHISYGLKFTVSDSIERTLGKYKAVRIDNPAYKKI